MKDYIHENDEEPGISGLMRLIIWLLVLLGSGALLIALASHIAAIWGAHAL